MKDKPRVFKKWGQSLVGIIFEFTPRNVAKHGVVEWFD